MDALFAYQKPDRVPIGTQFMSLGFNMIQVGGTITDAYADPEKCFDAFLKITRTYGWDQILQGVQPYRAGCGRFRRTGPIAPG